VTTPLELLLLAIAASFYPALLAIVIVFLAQPHPKRLLFFFLVGAMIGSVSIGLVCVFALDAASLGSGSRGHFSAGVYIAIGLIALFVAMKLFQPPKPKKKKKKKEGPSMTQRVLTRDSAWLVLILGIVVNMPGLWYLMALKDISLANWSDPLKVIVVVLFNIVMFSFVELPLIGYFVEPEWTRERVNRFNAWLHLHARHIGAYLASGLGAYLISRGIFVAL
jgi:uncharacterized membrane protein YuzA (DUF378 family)